MHCLGLPTPNSQEETVLTIVPGSRQNSASRANASLFADFGKWTNENDLRGKQRWPMEPRRRTSCTARRQSSRTRFPGSRRMP
jgi:hypothetical protein